MPRPFRLQSLLEHKRQQEERQTLELAALDAEFRRVREALEALRREEDEQLRQIAAMAGGGPLDAEQYRTAMSYLDRLGGAIARQADALTEAEGRVLESRDALVGTLKEKRSLERLRERHATAADLEEGRREAGRVDDITSARYARRAGEGV